MAKTLMAMLFLLLTLYVRFIVGYNESPVPAVFIFGDSTFDVGTNNLVPDTLSRADELFYGIDFLYSEANGRFSNGFNTADRIVQLLGYKKSPLPFLYLVQNDPQHFYTKILKGVNFAAGGSGILDGTGKYRFVRVITMAEQILQFSIIQSSISQHLNGSADTIINKSLFLMSVGSNDINEFLIFNASHSNIGKTIQQVKAFLPNVMGTYKAHLKKLINLGAKKFGILGLAPLGCVPDVRASYGGNCSATFNVVSQLFHRALHAMLLNLSSEFPDMKYSLGNTYHITMDMVQNPAALGLKDATTACCGNQTLYDGTPCSPEATVCEDRRSFLFWDRHHPTEYGSKLAALALFSGSSQYVAPINFSMLVQPS